MFNKLNLIRIIPASLYLCITLLTACTTAPSVKETLESGSKGAVNMILLDSDVYKKATTKELDAVTISLLFSTLKKMAVLKRFEQEIGGEYKIEESFTVGNANQFCWVNNFLLKHRKELPSNLDRPETYNWIEAKQKVFKKMLDESLGERRMKDDCRN
ncbi:hypothetical protein F889_02541 [Acinetobacter colistiniresistens]|uniref:Lipoprotein n=1 Tax=Acinetobacter colistiniresistens TaxID=280145 RepID=N9R404_9GAMM|nr:hypothetical protein [Acinetobacter colistiniresistens]ENX33877.1 hypothetical protein F889_02541 [Acinetobacter colistiniresistens]